MSAASTTCRPVRDRIAGASFFSQVAAERRSGAVAAAREVR